jgi:oligosaccharide repeat unit polymerase
MPTTNLLLLLIYTVLVCGGMAVLFPYRRSNPVFWFLAFQWVIAAGTMAMVDLRRPSDTLYTVMFFVALLAFSYGAAIGFFALNLGDAYSAFWGRPAEADPPSTRFTIFGLVLLSITVTAIYYRAVGYNLFVELALGRTVEDFTSARLAAYSGDRYFAPGYVNQFKNVLLPLGLSAMCGWAWFLRKRWRLRLTLLVGVPVAIWALLGTGQRGFLVYAFLAFLFGLATLVTIPLRKVILAASIVVLLFGILSYYLGRIDQLSPHIVFNQILKRLFVDDQLTGLTGFRYIYGRDVVWFSEWGKGFLGLLPGNRGSDLDHQVFAVMHGTTRGTATMSTLGSIYHNGGVLGVVGIYAAMGFLYTYVYSRFLRGSRTVLRCFAYGVILFYLAFFVAGAPVGLVNKGVVTAAIVLLIRKIQLIRIPGRQVPSRVVARPVQRLA